MSGYGSSSNDSDVLNENSLPVELQTKNIINPAYAITSIPSTNGPVKNNTINFNGSVPAQPYIVITEQPQQRGFRFRYECEGPSHGGLQGTKSERSRKSYPSIKIENYSGAARVVVSLVTDEKTPRSHAHKLVGTNCKNGLCTLEIKTNLDLITFPNLCILHVTRKKLVDVLTERILDTIKLNKKLKENNMNFDPPITDEDKKSAKHQAEEQSKTMQLNVVRLCFQVFLRNPDGSFGKMLQPVVSQPIYDSKSPGASALKICRMDKYGGCCSGNEEVFLLCEKVQKDDIQVRFVEQNPDGTVKWEAYGNFGPLDVHRQYAIVFKTPAYWNTNIDKAVNVLIMLQRKSDQEVSEPKAFTYFPQNRDKDNIASKKRKRIPLDGYDFGGDGGLGGTGMGGDGGGGPPGSNGPGGGGGNSGGNGTNGNRIMLLPSGEMMTQRRILPTPVEDAVREYGTTNGILDSERLLAAIEQNQQMSSPLSTANDPWLSHSDSDIEVDAAVLPSSPTIERNTEFRSLHIGGSKSSLSPKHHSRNMRATRLDTSWSKEANEKTQDKARLSHEGDWMDSGVGPDSTKSIMSIDERKFAPGVKDVGKSSVSDARSEGKEDKEDTKTNKSSSGSDYHSEPDTKLEIGSVGVRSDEGFSETSEETTIKGQQLSPVKLKNCRTGGATTTDPSSSHCSQLTDTVKKVTGRVAERTVAALTDFAETGDIRHLLLVQRHLLTVSNKNGDLPLHLAVINSQPEALKGLLDVMSTLPDSQRHINCLNFLRQSPLHLAAVMEQDKMVEMLLHARADPTIADRNGNTAAHLAVLNESVKSLKTLVKYLRPGQTHGDPFPELNYLNYDGYSPIHLAAQAGYVEMLKTLVFGQADVDLPDGKSGKTALHHSVDNDDLPVASYLLIEAHTDVNARCFDGNTALHIACARQRVGMVALLVTAGADMECENEEIPDPEEGREEGGGIDRRGLKPKDYADDNEQILRILSGNTATKNSTSPNDGDNNMDQPSSKLSVVSGSDRLKVLTEQKSTDSGLECISVPSENTGLNTISSKIRINLSKLLDPVQAGQDVLALAQKLGYSNLIATLEEIRSGDTSPTTFLLEYMETEEGTVAKLRETLQAIGRDDVAALIPLA